MKWKYLGMLVPILICAAMTMTFATPKTAEAGVTATYTITTDAPSPCACGANCLCALHVNQSAQTELKPVPLNATYRLRGVTRYGEYRVQSGSDSVQLAKYHRHRDRDTVRVRHSRNGDVTMRVQHRT